MNLIVRILVRVIHFVDHIFADFPTIKPFVVSVWYGEGKPKPVNDFLYSFVSELKKIISNGIMINGHKLQIKVRCFLCDTPARSFLKGKHAVLLKRFQISSFQFSTHIFYIWNCRNSSF